MRLKVLDSGHSVGMKTLFGAMRAVTRLPVPDAIKLNRYRPDFYGRPMRTLTQEAMRGSSAWSVGDRELMGAVVSQGNQCEVCTKTHGTVAAMASGDEGAVSAVLTDLDSAPIGEPLRETIRMLRKLTRDHTVDEEDMRRVLAAGVSREQIVDALAVCFTFNTVDRLSRTFNWHVSDAKAYETGARFLLKRGYG